MQYGTLINGIPVPAPNPIHIGGRTIYNPPDSTYTAAGYLPIIDTPYPVSDSDTDTYFAVSWEEQDGQIVRVWTQADPPDPEPVQPTTEERVTAMESAMLVLMGGGSGV